MSQKDYISGPPLDYPIPDCSIAEHFIPLLRSHPKNNIIQVDAKTGFSETSRDLLTKSLKVCKGLEKLGLGQNDVFCLLARNASDVFAAILGVFWLGGIAAPVDTLWKTFELTHLFNLIQPTVIMCEEHVLPIATSVVNSLGQKCKFILFASKNDVQKPHLAFEELLTEDVDVDSYVPLKVQSPSTKVALIVPTSGSTGFSKGVAITHRNIIFQVISQRHNVVSRYKSCLVLSHLYWLTCFLTFLTSLENGLKRIYMSDINLKNILEAIHSYKPEMTLMGAPVFTTMVGLPDIKKYDLSGFKAFILAGCVLTTSVLDDAKKIWKKTIPITNCYGSSEMTGAIASTHPGENPLAAGKVASGVKIKVVSVETGKALGPNEKGEILATSEGIMKGYINNEEATKEIIKNGWYHTGDLGYYDDNEVLHVVGRLKEMIKCGFGQISPSEIEQAIAAIPGVKESGVVGLFQDTDKFYLVSLVVKEEGAQIAEEDIRNFLKENLSSFKVPKVVKFVTKLPRTSVGKIKRKDLMDLVISLCETT